MLIFKNTWEPVRKIIFPLPQDQNKQGFEPNFYIASLRKLARAMIFLLQLNGKNRFSNEFIQMLDPKMVVRLPNSDDELIFRTGHGRLLWRASTLFSEEPLAIKWIDSFNSNDCFYDVGANVGNYSLYAGKRGIRTFSFEPEYLNLSVLYENIFLNQLQEKCTPIPIALGDTTKLDVFYLKSVSKGDALHSVGRRSSYLDKSHLTSMLNTLVMRLDDLLDLFDLPKPTALKIDVDGNELNVIKGAIKTLDFVKDIYIGSSAQFMG